MSAGALFDITKNLKRHYFPLMSLVSIVAVSPPGSLGIRAFYAVHPVLPSDDVQLLPLSRGPDDDRRLVAIGSPDSLLAKGLHLILSVVYLLAEHTVCIVVRDALHFDRPHLWEIVATHVSQDAVSIS